MDRWALLQVLTRYLDGQLPPEKAAEVEAILEARQEIRLLADQLRAASASVRTAVLRARHPAGPGSEGGPGADCLPEALLLRLADGTASPQESRRAEEHLATCDQCLDRVLGDIRSAVSMAKGDWPELPPEVQDDRAIRALVHVRQREPSNEAWEHVTIQLPLEAPVRHRAVSGRLALDIVARPGRGAGAAALAFELRDPERHGRQISITDNATGRKLLSGMTDRDGRFSAPRVPAGSYTIHLLGSQMKIHLTVEG
ncbi:MAG: zf-HC2 domain-containing protein [Planctomycetota bacterium]